MRLWIVCDVRDGDGHELERSQYLDAIATVRADLDGLEVSSPDEDWYTVRVLGIAHTAQGVADDMARRLREAPQE